jgi:hypothetical protein
VWKKQRSHACLSQWESGELPFSGQNCHLAALPTGLILCMDNGPCPNNYIKGKQLYIFFYIQKLFAH